MDSSLTNFELSESTVKIGNDSENGSDKSSDPIELLGFGDVESSSSNKSEDDFDNNLPETVTLLKHEKTGAKVYLVGTAHFSKESQEDVQKVIRNVVPHIVVLELCNSRINILSLDEERVLEEAKNLNLQKRISILRSNGLYNGIMYLLLLDMSAHITKEIGMAPGGEFRVAFREAMNIPNCAIHLGDRSINITLMRALSKLTWFQMIKLIWHLITFKEPISVEDIEKCKKKDMLEQVLSELAGEFPALSQVFLEERDIFLTCSLQAAATSKVKPIIGQGSSEPQNEPIRVVGVVGYGHTAGIIKLWPHDQKPFIKDILIVPPPSLTSKFLTYSVRVSFLVLGGYLVYKFIPVPKTLKDNMYVIVQQAISLTKVEVKV